MTKYCPPIRRVTRGKTHHYEDADGRRVPGVTTILNGGLPKPQLINWAGSATAQGAVDNYVRFIDTWQLDPVLVEVVIVSYGHGYAGTLDLIADLTGPTGERERWLLDIKTGEKGIYPETALQLAAYRFSEFYLDSDGAEQPMPTVEHTGAIHITADDAQLIPTVSEREQLTTFRIAQKVYEYDKDKDGLILPALRLPTASTARVIWDDDQ